MKYTPEQQAIIESKSDQIRVVAGPGTGKCEAPGTLHLMFDGSIKKVEDLVVGDLLMGPDSKPRTVKSLCTGFEEMFEVIPLKGESFTVNRSHILSLKSSCSFSEFTKDETVNISIEDYLQTTQQFKNQMNLWRVGVDFKEKEVSFDPYVFAHSILTDENQRTFSDYIINSREIRLKLLAGLTDRWGHYTSGSYKIYQKNELLTNEIMFLARSLGLSAYLSKKEKNHISVSGEISIIPCKLKQNITKPRKQKKNVLRTGFKLISKGSGQYFGFTLEGDSLYLLADFTVSHNTTVIVGRIQQLIGRGVSPDSIYVFCFAKHDKANVIARLRKVGTDEFTIRRLFINNYHGFSLNLIRKYGIFDRPGTEIKLLEESESYTFIRKELELIYLKISATDKEASYLLKKAKRFGVPDTIFKILNKVRDEYCLKLEDIKEIYSETKFQPLVDEIKEQLEEIKKLSEKEEDDSEFDLCEYNLLGVADLVRIAEKYANYCRTHGYIDFMDMILRAFYILKDNPIILEETSEQIQQLLVDEFQDISPLQFELITILSQENKRIFTVGDVDQCQPAGTMVTLTGGQIKDIKDINVGDELTTYNLSGSCFVGIKREGKKVKRVSSRKFTGNLVEVSTDGKTTKCTPEHKWVVRFNNKSDLNFVTYLMRKGDWFQIGYCQLFNFDKTFTLGIRARLEKADAAWILGVHESKKDALIEESIISARFGIPTVTFSSTNKSVHFDEKTLDVINKASHPLDNKAKQLLSAFGRELGFPFYSANSDGKKGRKTITKIEACNLLSGVMSVPSFSGEKKLDWTPIEVDQMFSSCQVYSLEVEEDETYIADGIATHNCIYEWRNAKPEFMKDILPIRFKDLVTFPLSINFRSDANVIKVANELIKNNRNRLEFTLQAHFPAKEEVLARKSASVMEQASDIATLVEGLLAGKMNYYTEGDHKIAIIVRSARSISANLIRNALFKKQIPVQLRFESKIVEKIMRLVCSICNLIIDPKSPADLAAILGIIPGFGEKTMDKIREGLNSGASLLDSAQAAKIKGEKLNHVLALERYVQEMSSDYLKNEAIQISELRIFQRSFNLTQFLQDNFSQGKGALENTSLIDTTIEEIKTTEEKFIDYRDTLTSGLAVLNNIETGKKPNVLLCTTHHAKGGEWDYVICPDLVNAGGFPMGRNTESEEERRIFYVAITRAKLKLYLYSYTLDMQRTPVGTSPYLREMGIFGTKPAPKGRPVHGSSYVNNFGTSKTVLRKGGK